MISFSAEDCFFFGGSNDGRPVAELECFCVGVVSVLWLIECIDNGEELNWIYCGRMVRHCGGGGCTISRLTFI